MIDFSDGASGRFCWLDLAATDVAAAKRFYGLVFGWTPSETRANGGTFIRLHMGDRAMASMYQMTRSHLERGVPSHWTPYVLIDHVDEAARRVSECGGTVIVPPFVVQDVARIALFEDAVGALVGLWEALPGSKGALNHG